MSDSKRLRTLKLLTRYLETEISTANGYKHDLEGAVFRGRFEFTDDDPIPMISILENLNPDRDPRLAGANEFLSGAKTLENWTLLLQGWAEDDKSNPTDAAYELMADCKKALAKISRQSSSDSNLQFEYAPGEFVRVYCLGGIINDIAYEPGTVRPPGVDNSDKAFFWMRVILKFTEKVTDPYSYTA